MLRSRLQELVRDRLSRAAVARYIGVSDRTVRRWLAGDDNPTEENAAQVRALLRRPQLAE